MPIDSHLLVLFLVTTSIAMITPGPDMLFVLGCGMRGGPRAGLLATVGVATRAQTDCRWWRTPSSRTDPKLER